MLVIRLQRVGRENTPAYRIIVSEKTKSAKKGAIEILGHYLPAEKKPVLVVDQSRVQHWVSVGAQPSNTMARLLKREGMKDMEKFMVRYTKQRSKKEPPPEAPAAAPVVVAEVKTEEAAPAA